MKPNSTVLILEQFRNKAGCWRTQHKADKLLSELHDLLDKSDYQRLMISYSHFVIGEGAKELYTVCKDLVSKYSGYEERSNR
jgi:hypothetical protein